MLAYRIGWRTGQPVSISISTLDHSAKNPKLGFPLVLKYYFARIQAVIARIGTLLPQVLETNRPLADHCLNSMFTSIVTDILLAGLHRTLEDVDQDDELFDRFKDYVMADESKMKDKLETVMYCIDAPNTLDLVTNSAGRVEKVSSRKDSDGCILISYHAAYSAFDLSTTRSHSSHPATRRGSSSECKRVHKHRYFLPYPHGGYLL